MSTIAAGTNYTNKRIAIEATERQGADAALQSRIECIAPPVFSTSQVATLQNLAEVLNVSETNILVTGNLCVAGNIAIADGHILFANDGGCSGNLGGITIFTGNVGIAPTSSLYVNAIRPIEPVSRSPADCPEGCFLQPGGLIVTLGAPILFRR